MLLVVPALTAGLVAPSDPPAFGQDDDAPALVAPDMTRSSLATVLSVQDGDSITVRIEADVHRVEILGANAPDWIERAEQQRPYAVESRRFLTNMLLGERVLLFEPQPGATDPLGRRRAYVFRLPDMMFVDLEIVRQGYGRVSARVGEPYEEILRHYEHRARELRRGLWDPNHVPEEVVQAPQPPRTPPPTRTEAPPQTGPADAETPPRTEPARDAVWVWITRSGTRYHREDCSHLTSTRTRVRRDSVRSTHEPCRTCTPDA
ncbi:MAG: thermonuclease family protein [Phycisphaerales bacterium]|nr:thermonuclease family protein [Planctomycetota bacterium]MCH8507725.1 thermonuclease family protein [Phycisphaerales bacterium]